MRKIYILWYVVTKLSLEKYLRMLLLANFDVTDSIRRRISSIFHIFPNNINILSFFQNSVFLYHYKYLNKTGDSE